ncbi:hypothetical protein WA538_001158 [Blastocystis sp. DL]
MISYVQGKLKDASQISAVIRSTLVSTSSLQFPECEIQRMFQINTEEVIASQFPEYEFICAIDGQRMVGVGSVSREYVKRLFVLKEYQVINGCGNDSQGRGIGSSILKRLLSLHDSKYPSDVFPFLFFLSSHYR